MTFDHPQLLEALEHRTLILFLGADFLRTFTGLPSRADLARGMAERYGVTSTSSLAQVAQRVSRAGNRFDFTDYLRRELDTAGQPVPAFYRGLATFAQTHQLPAIVTTVYDDFFDRALSDTDLLFDRIVRGSDVAFTRPDRLTLLKLYGDAQMPDTLVVTEDDHYGLWRDRDKEALLEEVKRTLQRNTVLFLGYNLSDPDFKLLWREVLDKLGRFARPAYAIWPGLPEEEQRVWRDRNIQVLESDPWGLATGTSPAAGAAVASPVVLGAGEEQAAGFGALHIPTHLRIELEEKRREVTALEAQYGGVQAPQMQTAPQASKPLLDVLKVTLENEGMPHQPRGGGQWFSRLAVESTQPLQKCEAKIHRIRRLDDPSASDGEPLPVFTPSYLSWARGRGLFGEITLQPGREEYLDLAWRAHGDPPIAADELRVASSVDLDRRRDTTSADWGVRQDFIALKPGYYLFTVRVFAGGYADWVEGEYRLYWPGAGREVDIRLVERDGTQMAKGSTSLTGIGEIRNGNTMRLKHEGGTAMARNLTPVEPRATLPTGPIRNRWALLVGVDAYIDPAFPRLKYCTADVLALQAALRAADYIAIALHDDAPDEHRLPTRDNVEAELATICQNAGPDDLIWVHFSCHGKLVAGRPLLITREIRSSTLEKKALPLGDVERELRASRARRLVLTLDACHTGVEIGRDLADPEFIHNVHELAEGFALLAASTSQQLAQEWAEKQHGVFTYYLLEGLSGKAISSEKGFITVNDLTAYTLNNLRRWNVEHGAVLQEPTARAEGIGDMILADFRSSASVTANPGGGRGIIAPNPFTPLTGRVTDPARAFDRDRELRRVVEFLQAGSSVALIGPAAVGKSSLLTRLLAELPERLGVLWETTYLDLQPIFNEEEFFTALCDTLGVTVCRGYPLHSALRERRIVLAVDEVDKMAWEGFSRSLRTELRGLASDGAAPLKLLLAARQPLDVLFTDSEGDTSPLANICLQVDVGPWDEATARAFLMVRLKTTGVTFTEAEIARLVAASGGYPQRLVRAAYDLFAQKAAM